MAEVSDFPKLLNKELKLVVPADDPRDVADISIALGHRFASWCTQVRSALNIGADDDTLLLIIFAYREAILTRDREGS